MIFRNWVLQNFPFLEDDFDALTDYELFCKMIEYMRKSLDKIKEFKSEIDIFSVKLDEFEHYFDNLDVQEEVNNKLDEMVEDGTMEQLIAEYLQLQSTFSYNTVAELKEASNLVNGMFVRTSGYHSYNDGGGAYYKVRNVTSDDVIDDMFIIELANNEVIAELIVYNELNVNQLGAYGDNTHDDTLAIQKALDSDYNITFNKAQYLVSKNDDLNFTNHDEPCLLISKPKIINGNGAELIVNEHAQGILEIIDTSYVVIDNLILTSDGGVLPLDGVTGKGEKGDSTGGYDTEDFFGIYYNNCYDTSGLTTHGNGGNAWGTFNDGFIGNVGVGILVHNDSHDITIKNCEIKGFNYSGIHLGKYSDRTSNLPISSNISILNNIIHDIYDNGIAGDRIEYVNINQNKIYNIGHPDALYTNTVQNPGYGITFDQSYNSIQSKNVNVTNNIIYDCVRKGIDLHGGENMIISGNTIENCMVSGIFSDSLQTTGLSKNLNIINNQLYSCSYSVGRGDPIFVRAYHNNSTDEQFEKNTIISNNLIENSGCERAFIDMLLGSNVIISNNIIKGVNSNMPSSQEINGILAGSYVDYQTNTNIQIYGNSITVPYTLTSACIVPYHVKNCSVHDNIINCTADTNTINFRDGSEVVSYNNLNYLKKDGNKSSLGIELPLLSNTTSITKHQLALYQDNVVYKNSNSKTCTIPQLIYMEIEANGTSSPVVNVIKGSEMVSGITPIQRGFEIDLLGVDPFKAALNWVWISTNPFYDGTDYCPYINYRAKESNRLTVGIRKENSGDSFVNISDIESGKIGIFIFI